MQQNSLSIAHVPVWFLFWSHLKTSWVGTIWNRAKTTTIVEGTAMNKQIISLPSILKI